MKQVFLLIKATASDGQVVKYYWRWDHLLQKMYDDGGQYRNRDVKQNNLIKIAYPAGREENFRPDTFTQTRFPFSVMGHYVEEQQYLELLYHLDYSPKKMFSFRRVKEMYAPVGKNGKAHTVARFNYYVISANVTVYYGGRTEVFDVYNNQTSYYYFTNGRPDFIQRAVGQTCQIAEVTRWGEGTDEGNLISKYIEAANGEKFNSKSYEYDGAGNVLKEHLWGNITGNVRSKFQLITRVYLNKMELNASLRATHMAETILCLASQMVKRLSAMTTSLALLLLRRV